MSNSTKYLGVFLDEELNWKIHVNLVTNGLRILFPVFYNIRKYLSIIQVKTIYYILVYSKIKYGILMYGTSNNIVMNQYKLFKINYLKYSLKSLINIQPTNFILSSR